MNLSAKIESNGYLAIHCDDCDGYTQNEYLGWGEATGNTQPTLKVSCKPCGKSQTLQLDAGKWKNLPAEPST